MTLDSARLDSARLDPTRLERLDAQLATYVDDGRLAGWQLAIAGPDDVLHEAQYGHRDREAGLPVVSDTIWRIASMTKPVTSVTAMALWEEGVFDLDDPISRWIPEFADARVYVSGRGDTLVTEPVAEPVRVRHVLTHTSGLTAGFMRVSVVDEMYRDAGYEFASPHDNLADCVTDWARLPLLFQPGRAWGYGVSTDVLGRLVEIWTGQTLDVAFRTRVFDPLKMADTAFSCDASRADRLAALYALDPDGGLVRSPFDRVVLSPPGVLSGGGGLVSTVPDYVRFTQMLLRGGELDGVRVLRPETVELMRRNHLSSDLGEQSTGGFAETSFDGIGFGLGFAVLVDPEVQKSPASRGEDYWGGIHSTAFWIDPVTQHSCVFMTQLMPSSTYPLRNELRELVYGALVRD